MCVDMTLKRSILVILFSTLLIAKGDGLKCYSCSDRKGQNLPCENPAANPGKVNTDVCTADNVCAIYTQRNPSTSIDTITRSCRPRNICQTLAGQDNEFSKLVECRTCETDMCDSGEFLRVSLVMMLVSFILHKII